jgi:hypothetical protein
MKLFTILWVCFTIFNLSLCQTLNRPSNESPNYIPQQINNKSSNIDTVCNFDPIAVGNRWVYRGAIYLRSPIDHIDSIYCLKEVLQEVPIYNKTYKTIFNNWPNISITNIEYERIDTATGMVYLLDNNINEFPADSLHAQPGDLFYASRTGYTGNDFSGRRHTNLDSNVNSNRYYSTSLYIPGYSRGDNYILTYGIGISFWEMIQTGQAVYLNHVTIALKGCVINGVVYGDTTYYKYTDVKDNIPVKEFSLSQNYPNPFNPSTRIKYSLVKGENVTLKIYDVLGREIETLVNGYQNPGSYEVEFTPRSLSDGVYIYRLQAGDNYLIKKMVYLK